MIFQRIHKLVAASVVVFLISVLCLGELAAEDARLSGTDLFEMGHEGFESARAPALAVMADGTVLCFASRKRAHSDWAPAEVVARRTADRGASWGPIAKIIDDPS